MRTRLSRRSKTWRFRLRQRTRRSSSLQIIRGIRGANPSAPRIRLVTSAATFLCGFGSAGRDARRHVGFSAVSAFFAVQSIRPPRIELVSAPPPRPRWLKSGSMLKKRPPGKPGASQRETELSDRTGVSPLRRPSPRRLRGRRPRRAARCAASCRSAGPCRPE